MLTSIIYVNVAIPKQPHNIPPHLSNPKTLSSCLWSMGMLLELEGGREGVMPKKKKIGLQSRGDGPKNRPWMSSHPNIITIKLTITIWILWQKVSDYSKIQFLTFWKFWFFPESMPISLHPPTHVVCYLNTISSHYYNPHS